MFRYGPSPVCCDGKLLIMDRVTRRTLPDEMFADRAERDSRIIDLNARAAIAALRDPTDEMLAAAVLFPEHLRAEHENNPEWAPMMEAATMAARMTVRQHWIDLIDAALSE